MLRFLTALLVILSAAAAEAAGVTARVNRDEVALADSLLLTLTVEGSTFGEPQLPDLSAFDVVPRGQSTSVQIINGVTRSSIGYNFMLTPKRVGRHTIGPASISIDGRAYQSQPFTVRVTGSAQARGPGANDG